MFRVKYYKEKAQALLIQRMMIWQGYGCPMVEDIKILKETGGSPSALLYRKNTPVASGFFAAADWLRAQGLIHCAGAPPLQKDRAKSIPIKVAPKTKPKPVEKVVKPADPFDIEPPSGPAF